MIQTKCETTKRTKKLSGGIYSKLKRGLISDLNFRSRTPCIRCLNDSELTKSNLLNSKFDYLTYKQTNYYLESIRDLVQLNLVNI